MTDNPPTGAMLLARSLEAQGVRHAFGIPGAKIDALFDALNDSRIEMVVCRHEQNACFIAQAIGRITGRPGVAIATSGPGVTNLATGLLTATGDGDPVVAIGGAVARGQRLKRTHQSLDNVAVFKPFAKYSAEVEDPDDLSEALANAFRAAATPRAGAAFLSVPQDVLAERTAVPVIGPTGATPQGAAAPDAVADAAALIDAAACPVLFIGLNGSRAAPAAAIRRLLKRFPLATVCTYEGAGTVSRELLDCFVGRVGLFLNQPGDRLLAAADLVLAVGFDPVEYDPRIWNRTGRRKIVHVDFAAADIDTYYDPAVELVGDVAATLDTLAETLTGPRCVADLPVAGPLRRELFAQIGEGAGHGEAPVHPLRLIHELRDMIGDDVTVACDIGSHYIWMARYFLSFEPHRLLFSNGQQTLGVALPWAIGACLARPGEKVVSISGDGGFLFSAVELETAVRLKTPFVHLVWRDGTYNMVRIQQMMKYGRDAAVHFGSPDIVAFAESFGARGMRISTPDEIRPVLQAAMDAPGPVIVDVPIDYRDNDALCRAMDPNRAN
ncbi:acetolactate synthase AlsS [Marinibaculum pumilum]|uniref:Acetolactate synthase AlsS n=1 Tax=Marinibaculum pumilum TaxID=1766165 RepID=A0ABV7KUA6_9PROT